MARKRDVIVAVIIGGFFIIAVGLFALIFIGVMSSEGDIGFAGLGDKIGIVEMYGVIDEQSGRPVIKQIEKWTDNSSVQALVIHINSPGGGVAISQEIYDAIRRASEEKPVVAAMASVAASGGYYIACAADRIIANQGTLTGSIGVIFQFYTAEGLMEKMGVGTETVKSGELKDVGSYSRSMTKKEELMLRSVVMDTYEQFVGIVADGRGMTSDEVYPMADGSIFTGLQAFNLGLIDTLGGLKEAVDLAADLANMEGEPDVIRPRPEKSVGIFDLLGGIAKTVKNVVKADQLGPQLLYQYK